MPNVERLRAMAIEERETGGVWSPDTGTARCAEYAELVTELLTELERVPVFMLSRYDGKGLFALAFSSVDALVEYVIDYYGDDDNPIAPLADGEDVDAWIGAVAERHGYELAINEDLIAVPLAWAPVSR